MDWIGSALIITAWFLISHKRRCGFLFNLVGSALWVLWAILEPAVSVAVVCAFYIFASVYGWLQWGQAGKRCPTCHGTGRMAEGE